MNSRVVLSDISFSPNDFRVESSPEPIISKDTVITKTIYLGLNAGMRSRIGRQRDGQGTISIGDTPASDAVLQVIESNHPNLKVGSFVFRQWQPWEEYSAAPSQELTLLPEGDPLWYATVLGHTGFTAWVSLQLANLTPEDHIVISSAAGGVGSAAVQFALASGAKVSGIASKERLDCITKLGANALDRKLLETGEIILPPFDVFHDGVGGRLLELAIDSINMGGRIMLCGAISGQTPRNYRRMIHKELNMRGFTVMNHLSLRPHFWEYGRKLISENRLKPMCNIHEGLERAGKAFYGMFNNAGAGRHILKL